MHQMEVNDFESLINYVITISGFGVKSYPCVLYKIDVYQVT